MEKIPKEKIIEIFKKSRCIIDAPQKGQNGLTIRTIECLGAKRKLITTNKDNEYTMYDDIPFYNYNEFLYHGIRNQMYLEWLCGVEMIIMNHQHIKNGGVQY